jgi:hypothetical protein
VSRINSMSRKEEIKIFQNIPNWCKVEIYTHIYRMYKNKETHANHRRRIGINFERR